MRKIIIGAMVSMDGITQAPGGPSEDPTKGFKFGGWVMPYFDQEFGEELDRRFSEKFDLLLGRARLSTPPRHRRRHKASILATVASPPAPYSDKLANATALSGCGLCLCFRRLSRAAFSNFRVFKIRES
jgi:hypothetical protein